MLIEAAHKILCKGLLRTAALALLLALLAAAPGKVAAQTPCDSITTPWHEDFDSYGVGVEVTPACWVASRNYDMGYPPHLVAMPTHSGAAALALYPGTIAESHYSMAIAPPLAGQASLEGLLLRFHLYSASTAARLLVGFCVDTGRYTRAFVPIDTLHVEQGSRWQEMIVDLGAYGGDGRRLAFRMERGLQPDNTEMYVDDVRIERCGTSAPTVSHVGSSQLTLHFESYGLGVVEVTYDGDTVRPAVSPLTLTGLTPDRLYTFSVGCVDGEKQSVSVRTMEEASIPIAYYENFNNIDSVMPRHWRRPTPNKPQVTGGVLRMMPAVDDSCMAVMPLPEGGSIAGLTMALNLTASGTARLVVGAVEFPDEPSTFVAIDTLSPTGTQPIVLTLNGYTGSGSYPALLAIGSGTVTVDNLRLAHCMLGNQRLYNITEREATIAWDTLAIGSGDSVLVEYGVAGFTPGSGTLVTTTQCPLVLGGLPVDTPLDVYIWPSCGDAPAGCDKLSFRTFAHAVVPPYCEGFEEGSTLPLGWVAGSGATIGSNSYRGSRALTLATGGSVTMPLLDDATPDSCYLEFYAIGSGRLVLGRRATPYEPLTPTDTLVGNSQWQRYVVPVVEAAGTCLAFSAQRGWSIDMVSLRTTSVDNAVVSHISQTSAQLNISYLRGDSAEVEYSLLSPDASDFTPGQGTMLYGDSLLTLTGLQPGGRYALHIAPQGGYGASCSYLTLTFNTLVAPFEIPYCQNFDGLTAGSYPEGWRRLSQVGIYPIVSTQRNLTGGSSLLFAAQAGKPTLAILPDADNCLPARTLAFWANAATGYSDALLLTGYVTDVTDAGTFVALDTMTFGSADRWYSHMVHLDTVPGHLAMMLVTDGAATNTYLENFCVEPCVAYNVRIGNLDSTSAKIYWEATDSLALLCSYASGGNTYRDTLRSSPATITGLNMDNSYTFRVETLCGCGSPGATYYSGNGSTGSTADHGAISFSINTRPSIRSIPYCIDFDGYHTGSQPTSWRLRGAGSITDRNYHGGSHSLQLTGGIPVSLPPLNNINGSIVSFHLYGMHESLLSDSAVVVGVMSDPDSLNTFTPVDTLRLTALGRWQHLVADMTDYSGEGKYITLLTPSGSGTLYLDELSATGCAIGAVTATAEGTVTWRSWHGVDSVLIEYGPAGFTPGDSNNMRVSAPCDGDNLHSHALTGLTEGNSYDIYLTPYCGSTASCQRLMATVAPSATTPYCENLEEALPAGIPFGWAVGRTNNATPEMATLDGSQTLHLHASTDNPSMAALPQLMVADIEGHQLTLRLRTNNHNRARLVVGQMTVPTDPNTFTPRDTLTLDTTGAWQTLHLALTRFSGTDNITLAAQTTTQSVDIWVDDIAVTRGLTPTVAVVSARSMLLTNSDTDYYVDYAPVGTAAWQGTVLHVTTASQVVGGLLPEQSYRLYSSHDGTPNCLAPMVVTMPREESLPYCHRRDTVSSLMLPEVSVDSVRHLHLYFRLRGGTALTVGVLAQRGVWESFVPIDTVEAPAGSWGDMHVSMAAYDGDGRFVALRTIGGTNAIIDGLMVSPCELPTVTLTPDNRAEIGGTGVMEYGPAGFTQGTGTKVAAPATVTLANNSTYDFYALCDSAFVTCAAPQRLTTAIDRCPLPDSLLVAQPGNGLVELSWDTAYSGFWIEYQHAGGTPGSGTTLQVTEPPLVLALDPDTIYDFYLRCDSAELTDRSPQQIATLAALVEIPYCEDFEETLRGWRVLKDNSENYATVTVGNAHRGLASLKVRNYYGTTYLVLPQPAVDSLRRLAVNFYAYFTGSNGHSITLGTMSDAGDPQTFDSLASFTSMQGQYRRCFFDLTNYYGNGRFLALRLNNDDIAYIDDLQVTDCAAYNFHMSAMEGNHVAFEWQQTGTPEVSITYRAADSDSSVTVHPTASPHHIDNLSPLTNYIFYISHRCAGDCDSLATPTDTFYTFTPQGGTGCIDYTDLYATYVTCSYGSYDNPTEHVGVVDNGYFSGASRHTVHFDTTERDMRTGGLLRTIPQGEPASIRLGNWNSGGNAAPEAESITYGMTVDANAADLLLLRYAAVLQDPEHSPSLQPRFRLEILNQQGQPIDSCSVADFIANVALGWNQAPNEVLWKDWTTVGIDLTPYNGQTIFVRLTTRDCGEGSHFGYAYFTLRCGMRSLQSEGCSTVPDNRFTVPTGFNYRWYSSLDSTTTISDSASIWVRSDNDITYYCRLSFIDNPQCHFTMSAFAGARYPLALFDTALTVSNCLFNLQLINRSTISGDGVTPLGTGEPVETLRWLLPDSTESSASAPTLHLNDTGTVNIMLVAGIANNQCIDTLRRSIHIAWPHPATTISGRTSRCRNDMADTLRVLNATAYGWIEGSFNSPSTIDSNDVVLPGFVSVDTTLTCFTIDSNGCRDTLRHTITVHPTYSRDYADSVCSSDLQYSWLDTALAFTMVDTGLTALLRRTTVHGCDSTMSLSLHLHTSYDLHYYDTICDAEWSIDSGAWRAHVYTFEDSTLSATGTYIFPLRTALHSCDSTRSMHLTVHSTYAIPDTYRVCDSLRWQDGSLYLADTVGATWPLLSGAGCDSVINLILTVYPSYHIAEGDSVCSSDLSYTWHDTTLAFDATIGGVNATLPRHTAHGCDSITTIALHLWPSYYPTPRDTICDDSEVVFYDTILNTSGSYLHVDSTTHGCDSMVTLTLKVMPTYRTSQNLETCDSLRWIDGRLYTSDTSGVSHTLSTDFGCDSVVIMRLIVHSSYYSVYSDTFCASTPYIFRGIICTEGGHYSDTLQSIHSCDSVMAVQLTRLEIPVLSTETLYNCDDESYTLVAHSTTPYLLWSCDTEDSIPDSTAAIITVSPEYPTVYTLYTDYEETPRCPATTMVKLRPFIKPVAVMRVTPQMLSQEHMSFEARDLTEGDLLERAWYIDSALVNTTDRVIYGKAAPDADTCVVWLMVYDGHCYDTAVAVLPVQRSELALPNIFTPDAESNNRFIIYVRNISGYEINIYNRRGMLVYHSTDINAGWDGRDMHGYPCPPGSYVYHLRYSTVYKPNAYQKAIGSVMLIR